MISLLVAWIVSLACPGETSWIEYDHDRAEFRGVCGDSEGQVLPEYRIQNHTFIIDTRSDGMCGD